MIANGFARHVSFSVLEDRSSTGGEKKNSALLVYRSDR